MNLTRLLSFPVLGLAALVAIANATPVTVQELNMGANEVVSIKTSAYDNGHTAINVYAGIVKLSVDGVATDGFCIDPFHFSLSGPQSYNSESLQDAPKPPGPMGADAAKQIEQLWAMNYSANMSPQDAAGLQIAIWEIVSESPNVVASGETFSLVSSNDYGASVMRSSITSNSPTTSLIGVTGPGQDYAIPGSVPDGGSTGLLLGLGLAAIGFGVRERSRRRKAPARN